MLFYGISFLIIVACFAGIAWVIVGKLPPLTLIDTETLPLERDAKKKKAIIADRVSRKTSAFGRRIAASLTAKFQRQQSRFRAFYARMLALDRQYKAAGKKKAPQGPARERIPVLIAEAEDLVQAGDEVAAEKKYIEVLNIDAKNVGAFRGLGRLYVASKRYEQAVETYAFLAKMARKENGCLHDRGVACDAPASAHADIAKLEIELGMAAQALGDVHRSREVFAKAASLEPSNPRYLDLLLDACILEGEKEKAQEVFSRLQAVNPDNNKLTAFEERIAAMPEVQKKKTAKWTLTPT